MTELVYHYKAPQETASIGVYFFLLLKSIHIIIRLLIGFKYPIRATDNYI